MCEIADDIFENILPSPPVTMTCNKTTRKTLTNTVTCISMSGCCRQLIWAKWSRLRTESGLWAIIPGSCNNIADDNVFSVSWKDVTIVRERKARFDV